MRLIDADKLIEDFRKVHTSFNGTPMEESDMMISFRSVARVINRQEILQVPRILLKESDRDTQEIVDIAGKCVDALDRLNKALDET